MSQKRTFNPIVLFFVLPILACVTLAAPLGTQNLATQTRVAPSPMPITETIPTAAPTTAPITKPTSAPQATPQSTALPPTAALAPEKQLHTVIDETGAIEANVPAVWTDMKTEPWLNEKGVKIGTTFTASTDIEAFLKLKAEGVSISVSRHLPIGYVQLLEKEYGIYTHTQQCEDTYKTRWKLEDPVYNGMYFVFGNCDGTDYAWLSLFTMVDKKDPGKYVARMVGYDLIPVYGEDFRTMLLKFKVHSEKLP
jgi:hypothetical protein